SPVPGRRSSRGADDLDLGLPRYALARLAALPGPLRLRCAPSRLPFGGQRLVDLPVGEPEHVLEARLRRLGRGPCRTCGGLLAGRSIAGAGGVGLATRRGVLPPPAGGIRLAPRRSVGFAPACRAWVPAIVSQPGGRLVPRGGMGPPCGRPCPRRVPRPPGSSRFPGPARGRLLRLGKAGPLAAREHAPQIDLGDPQVQEPPGLGEGLLVDLARLALFGAHRRRRERDLAESMEPLGLPGPDPLDHGERALSPLLERGIASTGVAKLGQQLELDLEPLARLFRTDRAHRTPLSAAGPLPVREALLFPGIGVVVVAV